MATDYTPHHEIIDLLNKVELYFAGRSDIDLAGPNEEMVMLDCIRRINAAYARVHSVCENSLRSHYETRREYAQYRERVAETEKRLGISYHKAA